MDLSSISNPLPEAFSRAQQQLRTLCLFSRSAHKLSDRMHREVYSTLPWEIEKPGSNPTARYWVHSGTMRGYAKLLGAEATSAQAPFALETEKLLTDIGYDLGLPVAPAAFATLATDHGPAQALVSTVQFANPRTLQSVATRDRADISEQPLVLKSFFKEQPHLKAAFAALSVFDIWTGNSNRQGMNIAIGMPDSLSGLYSALSGFGHQVDATAASKPCLGQGTFLKQMESTYTLQGAAAALNAIENYPAQRIRMVAQRLETMGDYVAQAGGSYAEMLIERQATLRSMMPHYLAPSIIDRLPHAALS